MQQSIRELITHGGLSSTAAARRAGVNRSTLHRIANGDVDPTLATLREIAIAYGYDVNLALTPLSDPDAATAARVMLDPEAKELQITTGVAQWRTRLERVAGDDRIEVTAAAGRASSVRDRPGAVFLRGSTDLHRLASAADAAGGRWALSGTAALHVLAGGSVPVPGPIILWTDDVDSTAILLRGTHERVHEPDNAQIIIAPASDSVFIDLAVAPPLRFAAPIQQVLDSFGLPGAPTATARTIAEGWG